MLKQYFKLEMYFQFRHTDTSRAKESAEYFARGVFGLKFEDPGPAIPDAIPDDRLIYVSCFNI